MTSKRLYEPVKAVKNLLTAAEYRYRPITRPTQSSQIRRLTTESSEPTQTAEQAHPNVVFSRHSSDLPSGRQSYQPPQPPAIKRPHKSPPNPFLTTATCTLHAFPSLEPVGQIAYPNTHLLLPLRRDILHKAVIYEGDKTRQGTASTKWRSEVHGSNRKIRPQKGSGGARLGDKKSPMLKGGGVAFGPKPRDFSTELPRKLYDLAWRTALSYRYRRGELIVLEGEAEIEMAGPGAVRWMKELLEFHSWGKADGRSLIVTMEKREKLSEALAGQGMAKQAVAIEYDNVDVKDLLETGRVVVEQKALDRLFRDHIRDLKSSIRVVV